MIGPPSEFSHPIDLKQLDRQPIDIVLQASKAERAAVARRLDLIRLDLLQAELRLAPPRREGPARLTGQISARLVQACVISLAPVPAALKISLDVELMEATAFEALHSQTEDEVIDAAGRDIEPVERGMVDLGELVTQYLSLELDPYPRALGVRLDPAGDVENSEEAGPFAALWPLRDRTEQGT